MPVKDMELLPPRKLVEKLEDLHARVYRIENQLGTTIAEKLERDDLDDYKREAARKKNGLMAGLIAAVLTAGFWYSLLVLIGLNDLGTNGMLFMMVYLGVLVAVWNDYMKASTPPKPEPRMADPRMADKKVSS